LNLTFEGRKEVERGEERVREKRKMFKGEN
jgi:hypothetical protein